jgi:hypothetical protein
MSGTSEAHQARRSLMILATQCDRLGLEARLESGNKPVLEVANPASAVVVGSVHLTGGRYVAFDGIVLASVGEPHAAAARLCYLLGLSAWPRRE